MFRLGKHILGTVPARRIFRLQAFRNSAVTNEDGALAKARVNSFCVAKHPERRLPSARRATRGA